MGPYFLSGPSLLCGTFGRYEIGVSLIKVLPNVATVTCLISLDYSYIYQSGIFMDYSEWPLPPSRMIKIQCDIAWKEQFSPAGVCVSYQ